MIITTSGKETAKLREKALRLSEEYAIPFCPREGRSLAHLFDTLDPAIFVVNARHGLSYYEKGKGEAFYHLNMAFHRLYTLEGGGHDTLASVCGLSDGMSFLDCTVGLASDALVAAYVVGEHGRVTGIEKSLPLSILVREGLRHQGEETPKLQAITDRLADEIHHGDNLDFLKGCGDRSYDVVYFDFMFEKPVAVSYGIQTIRDYAVRDVITEEHIEEAKRVARRCVVVKTDEAGAKFLVEHGFDVKKESSRGGFRYLEFEIRNF